MFSRRLFSAVFGSAAWLVLACGSGEHSDFFSAQSGGSSGGPTSGGSGGALAGGTSGAGTSTGGSLMTSGSAGSGVATTGSTGTAGASSGQGGGATGTAGGGSGGPATGAGGSVVAGGGGVATGGSAGGSGTGMGGAGGGGAACATNDTCSAGLYCKKQGCSAIDVLGQCTSRPTECDSSEAPICGCDGFTYFNTCLAEMNGQNVGLRGACGANAITCTPGTGTCNARSNGFCGILLTDSSACSALTPSGKCWVVPDECQAFSTHYDACDGQGTCIHTCDAIKAEKPWILLPDTRCQ